ncbi:MAG TPA: AAA family ATPase [Streptosporangiaceae bacterium]
MHPPQFTGRDTETRQITGALSDPPAMILVEGEAGIGKTRLVREALTGAGAGIGKVLVAVCPPFRQPLTLGPVVDALRQTTGTIDGLRLSALAGALRPLFPEWADQLPPDLPPLQDGTAARHRLFRALAELAEQLGVELLVVEDAHWGDDATLEFLLFLATRPPQRVSLLVTSRPEEIPSGSPLARLSAHPPAGMTCARVTLRPLQVADTASLISSMLGGEQVSEKFAAFLQKRSGGLPLAVEESVRLLCDSGQLIHHAGQWERRSLADLEVPPTVRDSVLDRAQRLTPGTQRVLQAAAVLTDPASESALALVARLPAGQLPAGLAEAFGSGLLIETAPGVVGFRHVLASQAVYEAIPAPARRRLHLHAARALEGAVPVPVAPLARHFREAGRPGEWCHYAEEAANLALAAGDDTTAATLLHDLLTHARLPAATVVRLARKLPAYGLSRHAFLDDLARGLRAALDEGCLTPLEQSEGRSQLGRILLNAGDYAAGVAELERAVPGLLEHRPLEAARAMVRLGWSDRTLWPARVHRQWLDRAAEIMTDTAFPATEHLELDVNRATALLYLGDQSGWDIAAAIPLEARNPYEIEHIIRACMNIGNAAITWGRYAEARRQLDTGLDLVTRHDYPTLHAGILANRVLLDWLTGTWDALAARAAALAGSDQVHPEIPHQARVIGALLDAADGAPGAEQGLWLLHDEERRRWRMELPFLATAGLARLLLSRGRVEDALAVTGEPIQVISTKGIWLLAMAIAPLRVEALITLSRHEEAAWLTAAFARGLRGRDAPAPQAALTTCRAILADGLKDPGPSARLFARAAMAWEALPQPHHALLARERQARCLMAADKPDVALALLSEVHRGLSDLGARADAERVAQPLRRHGIETRPRQHGGRRGYGDRLSPRELEVARLVATGRTNREIAQILCRSPNTVAVQLNSALRKLGISSRTALAVWAVDTGVAANSGGKKPDRHQLPGTRED